MDGPYLGGYEDALSLDSEWAPGGILVYYADGDEEIIHVNQYVVDLFECESTQEFMAHTQGVFKNVVYADDISTAEDSIWGQVRAASQKRTRSRLDHIYYRIKTKTGRIVSVDDFGRLVERDGMRPIFCVFLVEVSETGSIDWLTGLPDMARFQRLSRLGAASIRERGERPVAVAFDLMGMKTYNARHGRSAGDVLLRTFGDALKDTFGNEACSRFGEDHFYAFAAEKGIEQRVEGLFDVFASSGIEGVLPVRAGVYALDPTDDIAANGFDRAKIACDLDRSTWVSHLMWYTDEMRAAAGLRVYVLEHLDQAIAEQWIRPYYQGVVRAATGEVCGEEALARWVDPSYGLLPPGQFIPVLEEAGLLHKVDLHMLDCVVADMLAKRELGVTLVPVSINISVRDLALLNVADEVARRVDAAGLPHGLIHIEFTESALSSDKELFRRQVNALRDEGFEVWMDDFGSGYSSLNTLQEFDFDLIKLDMAFIRSERVEKSHVIVAGVVQAASKLGVDTLAEGVETEEQARFLESIGCDMLQGFFYARPQSLEDVVRQVRDPNARRRERLEDDAYWNAVGMVSLVDLPASSADQGVDMSPMSEIPMGVVERCDGVWRILRSNQAYADFLDKTGMLPASHSPLVANTMHVQPDEEFFAAADRSVSSGRWERIMGRLEYGSGHQYYVRYLASTNGADAFMVAGAPTMLGSALGTFGDVPVAYAVFRVILNETGDSVVDTEYVYANAEYCASLGQDGNLAGRSFLETVKNASDVWFPYCYRAAVLGEQQHDIVYSPETGHWLSCNVAPALIEGCCVMAFTLADDEHRERNEMMVGLDTSDLIIRIADTLGGEVSYEVAMNTLLKTMSSAIHPDRLYIYERGEKTTSGTFEWCAEGVAPRVGLRQGVRNEEFAQLNELLAKSSVLMVDDVEGLEDVSERMRQLLRQEGIARLLAVPLYSEGELVGYLGADNYRLEEGLDTKRLLKTVASFVSARIANRRLLDELRHAGTHDLLTGLLDRRGIDQVVEGWLAEHPDDPYVLALMDVDDFKTINDLHGHEVGDEALRSLARCVDGEFGADAIVGRNGGDEFLVMLHGDAVAGAGDRLARFVARDLGCDFGGRRYRLSLSVGYARYPEQAASLMDVYSKADAALYSVKLAGKGGCSAYSTDMDTQFRSQLGFAPRDIASNMPGAILVHRPGDSEILFANNEMVQLFECDSLEDFMAHTGGTFGGVIHPDDRDRVREELAEQAEQVGNGAKDYVNFRIVTKRGNVRRVADNGRQAEAEGIGKIFYELIVNRDERGVR